MARFCTETNALGSWNILDAVREVGSVRKVIYTASSTYNGNNAPPHSEAMAPDLLSPCAASKYKGELQMQMFDRHFGVPTLSTRLFMVYGRRQPVSRAYAVVTGIFTREAGGGKPLTIEGGSQSRDFVHVEDVVEGLIPATQNPTLRGAVVSLGSGTSWPIQEVANLISSNQVHMESPANDLKATLADTCKAKKTLGWASRRNFKAETAFLVKEGKEGNTFMQP